MGSTIMLQHDTINCVLSLQLLLVRRDVNLEKYPLKSVVCLFMSDAHWTSIDTPSVKPITSLTLCSRHCTKPARERFSCCCRKMNPSDKISLVRLICMFHHPVTMTEHRAEVQRNIKHRLL